MAEKITIDSRTNEVIIPIQLEEDSTVSIGLYTLDNVLVTQICAGEARKKGRSFYRWNKKDFLGNTVPIGNYKIVRAYHQIEANWLAGVGNSSTNLIENIHIGYDLPIDICIAGDYLYYTNKYYELRPKQYRALLATPNVCEVAVDVYQTTQNSYRCCSDGEKVYWMGTGYFNGAYYYFIYATRISDKTRYAFPSGQTQFFDEGGNYSCLAFEGNNLENNRMPPNTDISQKVVDIACQQKTSGTYFIFQLNPNNTLKQYNNSGAIVQNSIALPDAARRIECDAAGNLWVLFSNGVKKYTISSTGVLADTGFAVTGVADGKGIAIAPDSSFILVADGGTSQQKKFSTTDGSLLTTVGQAGGYANGPAVSNSKVAVTEHSTIAIQPDGTYWMIEQYNSRVVKYSAAGVVLDEIMYLPHTRDVAVDQNDATRVFAGLLEFKVDYSLPMAHGNGSWKLVNNWQSNNSNWIGFKDVITFPAGTFATVSVRNNEYFNLLVKLDAATGIVDLNNLVLNENTFKSEGIYSSTREPDPGKIQSTYLAPLTFQNGQSVFGALITIDSFLKEATDPFFSGRSPTSSHGEKVDNLLITWDGQTGKQSYESQGYHLGARNLNNHTWQWRTAWQTGRDYTGPFPSDERYENGNGTNNPGSKARVRGNLIYIGFHCEFWKGGQTNEYKIFHKNGMFLCGFGNNVDKIAHGGSIAGMAGNAITYCVVEVGGNHYLWHPDEGWLSRLHCWEISNYDTIQLSELSLNLSGTALRQANNKQIDLMEGFTVGKIVNFTNMLPGWSRQPAADDFSYNPNYWFVKMGSNNLAAKSVTASFSYNIPMQSYVRRAINIGSLDSWRLSFGFAPLNNPSRVNADPPGSQAAVILRDNAGKIIFVLDYRTPLPYAELKYEIAINGTRIVKWEEKSAQIRNIKNMEVIYVNGKLKVYMDGYKPVIVDPYEEGVNAHNLGSINLEFEQKDDYSQGYGIEVSDLMLYTNSDEIKLQNYGLGFTENNTSETLNLETLNYIYPGAPTDYQVYCPTINVLYQKKSESLWLSFPYETVS